MILTSDDMILGVIAHELYEIDAVEQAFIESGGRLEATVLYGLVNGEAELRIVRRGRMPTRSSNLYRSRGNGHDPTNESVPLS
jgi:hypothetical protein